MKKGTGPFFIYKGGVDASAYTVSIAGTIVLGNICGEGIAKVLNRQIGKGINYLSSTINGKE